MRQNNMLAMILAGGRGTRLEALTKKSQNQQYTTAVNIELSTSRLVTVPIPTLM